MVNFHSYVKLPEGTFRGIDHGGFLQYHQPPTCRGGRGVGALGRGCVEGWLWIPVQSLSPAASGCRETTYVFVPLGTLWEINGNQPWFRILASSWCWNGLPTLTSCVNLQRWLDLFHHCEAEQMEKCVPDVPALSWLSRAALPCSFRTLGFFPPLTVLGARDSQRQRCFSRSRGCLLQYSHQSLCPASELCGCVWGLTILCAVPAMQGRLCTWEECFEAKQKLDLMLPIQTTEIDRNCASWVSKKIEEQWHARERERPNAFGSP